MYSFHSKCWLDYIKDANKASQVYFCQAGPKFFSRKPILDYLEQTPHSALSAPAHNCSRQAG